MVRKYNTVGSNEGGKKMKYVYLLVLFMRTAEAPGFAPYVIDLEYETQLACYNAGFTAKSNHPKSIVWFNCERMPSDDD